MRAKRCLKTRVKVVLLALSMLICMASLLAGCQGAGDEDVTENNLQAGSSAPADWNEGFVMGPQQDGESLYVTEYVNLNHGAPEDMTNRSWPVSRVNGEAFYALWECYEEQDIRQFLEVHTPGVAEPVQTIELDTTAWEFPDASIVSFDVAEDGYVFLLTADYIEDEEGIKYSGSFKIVYTDSQGAMTSLVDLSSIVQKLQEKGLLQLAGISINQLYRDQEGYLYFLTVQRTVLFVLDAEGTLVTEYSCPGSGSSRTSDMIVDPIRDDSGRLIFPVQLGDDTPMLFYGKTENSLKELAALDEYLFVTWCGMYGSSVYYVDDHRASLIRWDVDTGLREKVLDMAEAGYSGTQNVCMLIEGEHQVWLRITSRVSSDTEDYVVALSNQEPEYSDPVSLVILARNQEGKFLSSTVADFNRKNPLYTATMEMDQENLEVLRTRTMADIMAGGGPDILCVSSEDMEVLAEMGALIPIDQLISDETLEALLPGIIQGGTLNGKLMGIAPEATVGTLVTSKSIWAESSWTLNDVLTLAEQKEGLEGIFTYGSAVMGEYNVLHDLIGRDLENTRFVDMETRESRFEQENFMQVLEVVKRFSGAGGSYMDGRERISKGAYLAEDLTVWNPMDFFGVLAEIDGEGSVVGFPTESGTCNFIYDKGLLVINAKSENIEAVTAFLEYLLSFENQATLSLDSLSVRSDMADRLITYNEYLESYVWNIPGGKMVLKEHAGGTNFAEEYNAFLQSCVPGKNSSYIFDIVWEEAQSYFSGGKDALTVTRTIDNRVQVYLDEGN